MSQAVISHPPPIQEYAVRHGTKLRFVTNAAFQGVITFQNLLDTMLMAATAVLGYDIFLAVKIRAVEVWAEAVAGTPVTTTVTFSGANVGSLGDQRLHTDSSMGVQPAHLRCAPSPKSLASDFQVSSSATAFTLSCPTGTVIDVDLTFVQATEGTATPAQNALVGAIAGAPYWRGLDGVAAAASKFTPAVYPTVII